MKLLTNNEQLQLLSVGKSLQRWIDHQAHPQIVFLTLNTLGNSMDTKLKRFVDDARGPNQAPCYFCTYLKKKGRRQRPKVLFKSTVRDRSSRHVCSPVCTPRPVFRLCSASHANRPSYPLRNQCVFSIVLYALPKQRSARHVRPARDRHKNCSALTEQKRRGVRLKRLTHVVDHSYWRPQFN